tara:strand:+ start:749 stop:1138 length:390 start_codon:yes stop_codon:yes gene_type:complete
VKHSSDIGKMGELAVRKELIKQGYKVYIPESDTEQVDLIVELENKTYKRVQVKTISKPNKATAVEIRLLKYVNTNRVDIIAIYLVEKDIIAFVPYTNQKSLNLALTTAKNNQKKERKWFYQFARFPEFS